MALGFGATGPKIWDFGGLRVLRYREILNLSLGLLGLDASVANIDFGHIWPRASIQRCKRCSIEPIQNPKGSYTYVVIFI